MKKLRYRLDLQSFAESGGDGGASAGGESGTLGGEQSANTVSKAATQNMPPKARKIYESMSAGRRVDAEHAASVSQNTTEEESRDGNAQKKPTYRELIESEDYKAEHERHVQRILRDRMRKYDRDAEQTSRLLSIMGSKYGLDVASESFRADLEKAMSEDDSIYERYAEEHDVPLAEAKRMVGLEQQMARVEQQAKERREAEETERRISELRKSGEETRRLYPAFDLDAEMRNEQFVRLTAALGGNTTMAYEALHHRDIVAQTVQKAAQTATQNVAQSVRSNGLRPSEAGISSAHATNTKPDFASMDRKTFHAYAAELRRRSR